MKKLLLGAVALVVLAAGPSVAADLATRAPAAYIPPPAPPPPTFTGCYVNGGAGYGLWNIDHFSNPGLFGEPTSNTPRRAVAAGWAQSAAVATTSSAPSADFGAIGSWARSPITSSWTCIGLFFSPPETALAMKKSRQLGQSVDGSVIWSRRMSSRTGMAATLKPVLTGSIFPSRPPTSSRAALAVRRHITAGS